MILKEISNEDLAKIQLWNERDRIELQTCRPVLNNSPVKRTNDVFNFLFYIDEITDPAGKIFYFDVNERNRSCEFGYTVNPDYRNRGIGKKMLEEFIALMFGKMNFNKLYAQTAQFNTPSVKLLESLGFKKDGVLREHHELDGKLYDDFIFSILCSEWKDLRSGRNTT